ncbi:MAG: hypothetical protein SOH70_03985 [Lentilactobacillus sunkii]|jgi:bisphosphoglycerate-independent phosphoglycerate mutase (AlkP superfamily)|uniref:hypothetical protein n=1 Tax=Lentilactobacillus sunkii TaxID=481719 RepID=UPI002F34F163
MKKYIQIRSDTDEDRFIEIVGEDKDTGKPVSSGNAIYMPSGLHKQIFDIPYRTITGRYYSKDELWDRYEEAVRP